MWRALLIQKRVIGALFMRELYSRWGRRNLGFAWLFLEPLVFAFPVLVMWSYMRSAEFGISVIEFCWSGYLPVLIFRHTAGLGLNVIRGNAAMLYHRRVTPFDIFIGKCGLEAFGNLASTFFSFVVLYVLGYLRWPYDPWQFLIGFLYQVWWALSVALLLAALTERSEMVAHFWNPIGYIYLPVSGMFYMVWWVPESVRGIVVWFPSVLCYELIRGGMWGHRFPMYYNMPYLTTILTILTLLGLWLLRDVRKYVEIA